MNRSTAPQSLGVVLPRPSPWPVRLVGPERLARLLGTVLAHLEFPGESLPPLRVSIGEDGRTAGGQTGDGPGELLWQIELRDGGGAQLIGQCIATATALLRRHLFVHAAAVGGRQGAWVLVGASGAGKSATVARLVARGAAYLSDEVALLDPDDARVAPFALPMALKPWTRRAIDALPAGTVVARDGAVRYYLPEDRASGPVDLAAVVLLRRARRVRLQPLSPAEVLLTLARHPSSFAVRGRAEQAFTGFARLLRTARCLSLDAPTPAEAAGRLAPELA